MAILVDQAVWQRHDRRFAHLVSDLSYGELHAFAARIELPSIAFHGDHYDLPEALWQRAVDAGAEPVTGRVLVARLRAAGLRRPRGRRASSPSPSSASGPVTPG